MGYKSKSIEETMHLLKESSLCNVNKLSLKLNSPIEIKKKIQSLKRILDRMRWNFKYYLETYFRNYQPCIMLSVIT